MTLRKSVKFSTYQQLSLKIHYSSYLLLLPASFDCCKQKGRSTSNNSKKFSILVMFLKHSCVFFKLHFPVLLLFCNVFLCCTVETFTNGDGEELTLLYFTIEVTVL